MLEKKLFRLGTVILTIPAIIAFLFFGSLECLIRVFISIVGSIITYIHSGKGWCCFNDDDVFWSSYILKGYKYIKKLGRE